MDRSKCFNIFRFFPDVSTSLQKMLYFGQCIWKLIKFIFKGFSFCAFWSAEYLNFGDVSCEIKTFSPSIQKTYTLMKAKKQVLFFLSSWEPNLSDLMLFCKGLKLKFLNVKSVFLRMQFLLVAIFFLYFWFSVWVEIYILNFLMSF